MAPSPSLTCPAFSGFPHFESSSSPTTSVHQFHAASKFFVGRNRWSNSTPVPLRFAGGLTGGGALAGGGGLAGPCAFSGSPPAARERSRSEERRVGKECS